MIDLLALIGGIGWTIAYIEAIRIGVHDKTYAIPSAALIFNVAWESLYAAYGIRVNLGIQSYANIVWFITDLLVLATFLKFGRKQFPSFVTPALFSGWVVLLFIASYALNAVFIHLLGWQDGGLYSAYISNLVMSALFITLFAARGGSRGQSLILACAKWIGTLAATIRFGYLEGMDFILLLGAVCSIFDLVYIWLLLRMRQIHRAA